jgi:multidrug resistance efflux pump
LIYLYIAAAIAFAAVSGYAAIQHSGKLAAQAKVEACETKVEAMGEQIKQQNAAVDSLKATADAKAATAAQALAKAEGRAKLWDDQAKRLTGILTSRKPTDPQDCKAAWQEIRK